MRIKLHRYPKFYNQVILFVGKFLITELLSQGYSVRAAVRTLRLPIAGAEVVEVGREFLQLFGLALVDVTNIAHTRIYHSL